VAKAHLSWDKALVAGFLGGAYIALAGLLAIVVSSGLDAKTWGGVATLITGAAFSMGLVLVVIAGSELLTGNMA
jgi:formate/nitrite transporter FocA (FNT family)